MNAQEPTHLSDDDVAHIALSPEFLQLRRRRAAFLVPASIIAVASFLLLPLSILFAPDGMSVPVLGPLTPAFLFALALILLSWVLLGLSVLAARTIDVRTAELVRAIRKHIR
ncbi:MAG: DUF485 domain-containing protein [Vulcanimicrobiaceae bacterium]